MNAALVIAMYLLSISAGGYAYLRHKTADYEVMTLEISEDDTAEEIAELRRQIPKRNKIKAYAVFAFSMAYLFLAVVLTRSLL